MHLTIFIIRLQVAWCSLSCIEHHSIRHLFMRQNFRAEAQQTTYANVAGLLLSFYKIITSRPNTLAIHGIVKNYKREPQYTHLRCAFASGENGKSECMEKSENRQRIKACIISRYTLICLYLFHFLSTRRT